MYGAGNFVAMREIENNFPGMEIYPFRFSRISVMGVFRNDGKWDGKNERRRMKEKRKKS